MEGGAISIQPAEQQVIRVDARGVRNALEVKSGQIGQFCANRRDIASAQPVLFREAFQLRDQHGALERCDAVVRPQRVVKEPAFALTASAVQNLAGAVEKGFIVREKDAAFAGGHQLYRFES